MRTTNYVRFIKPTLLVTVLFSSLVAQTGVSCVQSAANPPKNHAYSPAVDAGDYVYVSGQGPRRTDGSLPPDFASQVRQALENVKAVLAPFGLTMEHVVYTQVYLEDTSKYADLNSAFA